MRRLTLATLAVWAAVVAGPAFSQNKPGDYALRLPVTTTPGAPLQRLVLPTEALVAARSAGLADVRIFDSAGQPAPITLLPRGGWRAREVTLAPMRIVGRPGVLDTAGVKVTVDGTAARVTVDGAPSPAEQVLLGLLFDTREVADRASALTLRLVLPKEAMVTISVESSADLAHWRPEGKATFYGSILYVGPPPGGAAQIKLNADLKGRYLRVSWAAGDAATASEVDVQGGSVTTARWEASPAPPPRVRLTAPRASGKALVYAVPSAASLSKMWIEPAGEAPMLAMVRLSYRSSSQPFWAPVGNFFVSRLRGPDDEKKYISLRGCTFGELKVEPDKRGSPLGADTEALVELEPAEIIFVAGGAPPYTLAVGREATEAAYIDPGAIIPANADGRDVPIASVPSSGGEVVIRGDQTSSGPTQRQVVLWSVLIVAALLLAGMVALLWRGRGSGGEAR